MINWLINKITKPMSNAFTKPDMSILTHHQSLYEELSSLKFIIENISNDSKKEEVMNHLLNPIINNTLHGYCSMGVKTISNHIELLKELKKSIGQANKICHRDATLSIVTKLDMYIQPLNKTIREIEEALR